MTTALVQPATPPTAPGAPRTRTRPGRRVQLRRWSWRALALIVAIGGWQLLVTSGVVSSAGVAGPSSIADAMGALAATPTFWVSIWDTVRTWAIGLLVALAVAVPLGIVFGSSNSAYRLTRFTVDFLRTIPPVALIPLALLLYGATVQMALVLVVFGSVWPLLLQTIYGVHDVDPLARDVARSYRWRRRDVVTRLVVPSAAPFVATGIRIAATISLLLAIGAELVGGAPGIGAAITEQQESGNIPQVYAYIVVAAVLGALLNLTMRRLERKVLRWHSAHR